MPTTLLARSIGRNINAVRSRRTAFLVLCALLFVATTTRASSADLRIGEAPPDLAWLSVAGDTLSWDSMRQDHPLIMVFWATWCAVCKRDWPKLKELAGRYDDAPLAPVWAAVSVGEEPGKVARVAASRKLPGLIIADPGEKNGKIMGIEFVPVVCVLDADGRLAYLGPPKIGKLNRLLEDVTSNTKGESQ
ncbi:MAG: TlpA family protein disulfide reductase [Candidatus Krumholzibacteriia bacterium]